ncbi:hypothetical protein [Streptomyces sp. FH025]|uniref:hypothetical protein n=1 Tax=Streptomyces sp. FH025 TaxID=2815937 RepID=UPI001A9EAC90|nr:hypothetical protein [Streptomyces sp. FH025]MBO1415311.1 hypothetical protein [Streptomyces sp. FH025]
MVGELLAEGLESGEASVDRGDGGTGLGAGALADLVELVLNPLPALLGGFQVQ